MQETEKRAGLTLDQAMRLKPAVDNRYIRNSVVNRTVMVKVDNDDFSPNPDVRIDIKTKLIGDQTLLSVKYGSWHGDAARQEHEVRFQPEDLGDLLAILKLFSYSKFVVLETVRTTWISNGAVITLDEYSKINRALFEVELEDSSADDVRPIDEVFISLGVKPMNSEQTVEFISGLNRTEEIRINLDTAHANELAKKLLAEHAG